MPWQARQEASDQIIEYESLNQLIVDVNNEQWAATDEVLGPADDFWQPFEDHPRFSEAFAAQERLVSAPADETVLDMTALIDVTLVLLIFFIIATSYQALEKILDMPTARKTGPQAIRRVQPDEVKEFMIQVTARQEDGQPSFVVEGKTVAEEELTSIFRQYGRASRKNELLLDAQGVSYGTVVKVIDAAGGAGIEKVHFQVKE